MGIYKDFYGKAREEGLTRAALEETLTLMDQATSIMRVPAEDLKILMPHPDGMVVGDSYLFREVDPNKIGSDSAGLMEYIRKMRNVSIPQRFFASRGCGPEVVKACHYLLAIQHGHGYADADILVPDAQLMATLCAQLGTGKITLEGKEPLLPLLYLGSLIQVRDKLEFVTRSLVDARGERRLYRAFASTSHYQLRSQIQTLDLIDRMNEIHPVELMRWSVTHQQTVVDLAFTEPVGGIMKDYRRGVRYEFSDIGDGSYRLTGFWYDAAGAMVAVAGKGENESWVSAQHSAKYSQEDLIKRFFGQIFPRYEDNNLVMLRAMSMPVLSIRKAAGSLFRTCRFKSAIGLSALQAVWGTMPEEAFPDKPGCLMDALQAMLEGLDGIAAHAGSHLYWFAFGSLFDSDKLAEAVRASKA